MKILFLLMAMALPVCLFTACGSDDDGDGDTGGGGNSGGGSTSTSSSVTEITGTDGSKVRLSSDFSCSYTYDEKGNLIAIVNKHSDTTYPVSYNPFKITMEDGNQSETMTAEFNKKGYISKLKDVAIVKDEYSQTSFEDIAYFTYDNDSHLTKITGTRTKKETYQGQSYTSKSEYSESYTWNNGLLTKIVTEYSKSGGAKKDVETITYTYEGGYRNNCFQYTFAYNCSSYGIFQRLGFCGKGSSELPKTVSTYYSNGEGETENVCTEAYTYTFNNNGTVKEETVSYPDTDYQDYYNLYRFTYTNEAANEAESAAKFHNSTFEKKTSSLLPLFSSKRLNRNRQK
ncbi:MAG: DUF4595 domain-containing protein [Prevotella sp.]|nr:DUF4595 domain-containing protein [Prevotella sp.]